ncbi:MAG: hypothetical protein WKF75_08530 [Singulisphaera sp.]
MMGTLIDWSVADRVFDFSLMIALGVTLLSGVAWAASRGLPRKPATRHLILSSALICCLGMPVLAAAFTVSGWTLISIPLLPGDAGRDVDTLRPDSTRPGGNRLGASPEGRPLRLVWQEPTPSRSGRVGWRRRIGTSGSRPRRSRRIRRRRRLASHPDGDKPANASARPGLTEWRRPWR